MLSILVSIFTALLLPIVAVQVDPDLPVANKFADRLPTIARLFQPINVRDTYLQKSAESLRDDQCGGTSIVHRDIAMCNASLSGVFVIPHSAIRHNGEDCGTGRNDEYILLVAGEKLLSATEATKNRLGPLYGVLSSNARAANALTVLNDLDPVYVGFEYNGPRVCGGQERFPRSTIYFFINVSPGSRDLNFRFAYLGTQELGLVTIKPDEQLCLLKESRDLGPNQSPFATPTPSPSSKSTETPMPETIFNLDNPADLDPCFPVFKLNAAGSPLPQPSMVIGPTPNPTVTVTPSTNATTTPQPSTNVTTSITPTAVPSPSTSAGSSAVTTKSPSPSPSPTTANSTDDGVCFPSAATVRLESGLAIPVSDLRIGDKVLVAGGKYSEVFMFTHHTTRIRSIFVRITVSSGESMALSPTHYIPISGQLKAARAIVPGEQVTLASGKRDTVVSVRRENLWGLHNPQTMDGTIVVDGIVASTFTEAILPSTAVALLAPIKFLYALGMRSGLLTNALATGKPLWAKMLPVGSALW